MKTNAILLGSVAILVLLVFPVHVVDASTISPPDMPGPFPVGFFKVWYSVPPYGRYWATIRYPALHDGWRAAKDVSDAPYPGVVVANGFAGSEWNIKWIPKHLASHGYVTICFTPPQKISGDTTQWASGFHGGVEILKKENNRVSSPLYGVLDGETFGAVGLSMGGGGCIEATGALGSAIDAAVALAPAGSASVISAARNITVPIQVQVGNNDGMVPPAHVLPFYTEFIPNTTVKEYLVITGGNHVGFIDDFFARFADKLGLDNPPGISFDEQRRVSSKYFTSWFNYHLKHLSEYYTYIFGDEAQNDFISGVLSDLRYTIP